MTRPVFRFAPSPNGDLHLGHAYSAMLNFAMARETGGRFLLRIEDIDIGRCRREYEDAILRDLAWLGLEWEEPVRRQSDHFEDYAEALDRLIDADLAYPAFMSRGEIRAHIASTEDGGMSWPRDPDGVALYPGIDRDLPRAERRRRIAEGEAYSWRLDIETAVARAGRSLSWFDDGAGPDGQSGAIMADAAAWGDVVIARRDVPTSYHLAVVVDDALQGITHVVRGRDLFHATSVQRLLQELLGLSAPVYMHHDLILGDDGRKLSKSRQDTALSALRAAGMRPADIARMVGLEELMGGVRAG
jgi:glutamyl-Q tRNA(Asp) synthetase